MCVCACVCMCACVYVCMCVCVCVCVCVYVCVCVCVCGVYVKVYVCTCMRVCVRVQESLICRNPPPPHTHTQLSLSLPSSLPPSHAPTPRSLSHLFFKRSKVIEVDMSISKCMHKISRLCGVGGGGWEVVGRWRGGDKNLE